MLYHETTNLADFKDDFDASFARMRKSRRPTAIVLKGKVAAVILSPREYESYLDALETRDVLEAIRQGRKDFADGRGVSVDEARRKFDARIRRRGQPSVRNSQPRSASARKRRAA